VKESAPLKFRVGVYWTVAEAEPAVQAPGVMAPRAPWLGPLKILKVNQKMRR